MKYLTIIQLVVAVLSIAYASFIDNLSFEHVKDLLTVNFILLILGPIMSVFIRSKDLKGFYTMLAGYIGLAVIIVL